MRKHPDLSMYGNSVTSRFMVLLTPEYHKASLPELKEIALNILNDPGTSVSVHKKRHYEMEIYKQKSITRFQTYIANLTMKGCNLSLNS